MRGGGEKNFGNEKLNEDEAIKTRDGFSFSSTDTRWSFSSSRRCRRRLTFGGNIFFFIKEEKMAISYCGGGGTDAKTGERLA